MDKATIVASKSGFSTVITFNLISSPFSQIFFNPFLITSKLAPSWPSTTPARATYKFNFTSFFPLRISTLERAASLS